MTDRLAELREGCVYRPRRWSGDTHMDLGGSIDEQATDALMMWAAAELEAARQRQETATNRMIDYREEANALRQRVTELEAEAERLANATQP